MPHFRNRAPRSWLRANRRRSVIGLATAMLILGTVTVASTEATTAAPATSAFTPPPAGATNLAPPSYAVASTSSDWVTTPEGLAYMPCSYTVPTGASVDADGNIEVNGVVTEVVPPCPYNGTVPCPSSSATASTMRATTRSTAAPTVNGWYANSQWTDQGSYLRNLTATSFVPSAPQVSDLQVIFLFPGLVNTDGDSIIQPVLQWGADTLDGGGNYWGIASWYVPHGNDYHSPLVPVNVGDSLFLSMNGDGCDPHGDNCGWAIIGEDKTQGTQSRFDATIPKIFNQADGGVLETSGVQHCNWLPANASATWNDIQVEGPSDNVLTPDFAQVIDANVCSMDIAASATQTHITWTN